MENMMDMAATLPLHTPITWIQFYEVINSPMTIMPGGLVPFSQDGVSYTNQDSQYTTLYTLQRLDDHTFYFNFPPSYIQWTGRWRFTWQIPVSTAGQLCLQFAPINTPNQYTIWNPPALTGTSWGNCQIIGDTLIPFTNPYNRYTAMYFQIVNPAANNQSIELISSGAGTEPLVASFIAQYLQ